MRSLPKAACRAASVVLLIFFSAMSVNAASDVADPAPRQGEFVFPLRHPGQYADPESGLFYNYRRYYDPLRGGYSQADPLGLAAGVNPYAYAYSQPTHFIDPNGLWSTAAHDAMIDVAFASLPLELRAKIKQGSAGVDALLNQRNDGAYMHAMRAPGQSIADARWRACEFLRANMRVYAVLVASPVAKNRLSAYLALGRALNPVMDSTSPQHRGWQVWDASASQLMDPGSQAWQHGDNSPEDLGHLTPVLKQVTVDKMLAAVARGDCSCLD